MSFAVTGIQAIPLSISFHGTDASYGPVSHAKAPAGASDGAAPSTSQTSNFAHPDSSKTILAPGTDAAPAVAVVPVKPVSTAAPVDTVTLSTTDKVRNLRQQGEGDTQIASTLNLPIKEVQSDLHLDTHVPQAFTVAPVNNALSTGASTSVAASA